LGASLDKLEEEAKLGPEPKKILAFAPEGDRSRGK
jgi:hypothetical protein